MMTTTFAAVALSAVLSSGAVVVPAWQTDYSKAVASAAAEHKPLAVFIGKGDSGYSKLVGGEIPTEAGQLLAKSFVCIYVDTDTAAGKSLARQFDISKGLVISCKGGDVQALRHSGAVTPSNLTGYLAKYSDGKTIATTETASETVFAPATLVPAASSCANGNCASSASMSAPTLSGGCANGRCPGTVTYSRRR